MNISTTIRISAETRRELAARRIIPQEPYDNVIRRILADSPSEGLTPSELAQTASNGTPER